MKARDVEICNAIGDLVKARNNAEQVASEAIATIICNQDRLPKSLVRLAELWKKRLTTTRTNENQ